MQPFGLTLRLFGNQCLDGPGRSDDILDGLVRARNVGNFDKVVGVFAVPDDGLDAVALHGQRSAGGMGIGFKLFLAALGVGLLDLDDDHRHGGAVGVIDHDIGPLGRIAAKRDREFDRDALGLIAVLMHQAVEPQLAHHLFGLGLHILVARNALEIGLAVFLAEVGFDGADFGSAEDAQRVAALDADKEVAEIHAAFFRCGWEKGKLRVQRIII